MSYGLGLRKKKLFFNIYDIERIRMERWRRNWKKRRVFCFLKMLAKFDRTWIIDTSYQSSDWLFIVYIYFIHVQGWEPRVNHHILYIKTLCGYGFNKYNTKTIITINLCCFSVFSFFVLEFSFFGFMKY